MPEFDEQSIARIVRAVLKSERSVGNPSIDAHLRSRWFNVAAVVPKLRLGKLDENLSAAGTANYSVWSRYPLEDTGETRGVDGLLMPDSTTIASGDWIITMTVAGVDYLVQSKTCPT